MWGDVSSVWGDVSSNLGRSPKLCYTIVVHCREQTHTKRRHVLFPDWVARWTALSTQLQPWIANGTISGFHVGDELCWGGLPYSNMSAMATTIGNTEWQASHTFWCHLPFNIYIFLESFGRMFISIYVRRFLLIAAATLTPANCPPTTKAWRRRKVEENASHRLCQRRY